jgi:hypothetical protein
MFGNSSFVGSKTLAYCKKSCSHDHTKIQAEITTVSKNCTSSQ